ncbi:MAG: hypothetical protein AAGG01_03785 [Planctomycetota bacterium]
MLLPSPLARLPRLASTTFGPATALGAIALASPGFAQWSNDPGVNLVVSDAGSDQSQPKLAGTSDGGTWVSWFDGIGSGWDVRIQRLNASGVEAFNPGGVLVADRSFSSTQDYGLDVGPGDDAFLAFRDDRPGGTQITATRITAAGTQPWGPGGAVLTSTSSFVANPKIAGTTDGGAVVAWVENAAVRLQKLDASGQSLWGAGVTLTAPTGLYFTADLQSEDDGAILSLVQQTGGFTSPRHLYAQRFDGSGVPLWGNDPVPVFTGGSLQIGSFPEFITDESGGAIFSWYSSSPSLQCFAQRIDAAGTLGWATDGVALAATASSIRVNPHVAFDPVTDVVYATWTELNGSQSQRGIRAQALDAGGVRLWSDAGTELKPLDSTDSGLARVVADEANGGALVFWAEAPSFATDQLFGAHVDAIGAVDIPRFSAASTPSGKSRLRARASGAGFAILTWADGRSDGGDIYAQNVAFNGALGAAPSVGSSYCIAASNSTGARGRIAASGSASIIDNDVTLAATELPPSAFGFFLASREAGFVASPGGSQGNLCLGGAIGRYVGPGQIQNSGPQGAISLTIDVTMLPQPTGSAAAAPGESWRFQAWHRDTVAGMSTSNLTDGITITFN